MDNIQSANRPVSSPINYGMMTSSPIPGASPKAVNHQNHLGVQSRYAGSSSFSNFGQDSGEPTSLTTSITTKASTTATINQISRLSPMSPAESNMVNPDRSKSHKVIKTEYKENFKPFDQYVYNEITDSFVRSEQPNLISKPNHNIKSSTSNQDLAQTSMNEQNLSSLQNTHDGSTFESGQAQSNTDKTSNGGASNNIANEPWYKEVIKRNEKANEYRFKSELGHNSHILNYTTGKIDGANKNQCADGETGNGVNEATIIGQAAEACSLQSIRLPVVYRYKRDNMIAQMARNNNFKLPKEPTDTANSTTNRVKTPVNRSADPSHLRSLTRSTAQSRARSQSSKRPESTTPNGTENTQIIKKADSTNTTPTRTPTYVTSKASKPQSKLPGTPRPSPATVASSRLASNRRALNTSASSASTPTSVNVKDTTKRSITAKPTGLITKKPATTQSTTNIPKTSVARNSIPVKQKTPITTNRNTANSQINARGTAISKAPAANKQLDSADKPTSIAAPIAKNSENSTSIKSNGLLKNEISPTAGKLAQVSKLVDDTVSSTVIDDLLPRNQQRDSLTLRKSDVDSNDTVSTNAPNLTRDVTPEPCDQNHELQNSKEHDFNSTEKLDISDKSLSGELNDELLGDGKVEKPAEELSSSQIGRSDEFEPIAQSNKSSISRDSHADSDFEHDIKKPSDILSDNVVETDDQDQSKDVNEACQHDELILTPHELADLSNEYLNNKSPSETSETSSDSSGDSQEHGKPNSNHNLQDEMKLVEDEKVDNHAGTNTDDVPLHVEDEIIKKADSKLNVDDTKDELGSSDDLINYSQDKLDTTDEIVDENLNIEKPKVEELILSPMQLADLSNENLTQPTQNTVDEVIETVTDPVDNSQTNQIVDLDRKDQQAPPEHSDRLEEGLKMDQVIEDVLKKHVDDVHNGQIELGVDPMMVENHEKDKSEDTHVEQYMGDHLKNDMADSTMDSQRRSSGDNDEKPRNFDSTPIESEQQFQEILKEIDTLKMDISDYIASREGNNDADRDTEKPSPVTQAIDVTKRYSMDAPTFNDDLDETQPEHIQAEEGSIKLEPQNREEEPYSILELDTKSDGQKQQNLENTDMLLDFSGNSSNSTDVSEIVHSDMNPPGPIDPLEAEKVDTQFSVKHPIIEDLGIPEFDQGSQENIRSNKEGDKQIISEEK